MMAQNVPNVTEYSIRLSKSMKNKHHVMRFNANLNVDFSKWRTVRMERENNQREFKIGEDEALPKFGAGSEYNKEQKEEARRKKFGIIAKKYDPERQPWILKVGSGSKTGKKFRGIREGGVSENAAHFVFTQTKDGSIEAVPLNEWYNFQPIQRYKALTAEEAEEEFGRRKKCVNMWTMKMRMKLKNKDDEEPEVDPEETKAMKSGKGGDKKKLQISDMDEWMDSDDISSSDEDEEKKKEEEDSDNDAKAKQKNKGKLQNQKKKKKDVDDEAFEESDDGDEEGRERDYISDSSDSESEPETKANKELKSVAEEDALRKLLTSDEDSDEEKSNKDEDSEEERKKKSEDQPKENEVKPEKTKEKKSEDKKTKLQKVYDKLNQGPGTAHASDFSSDSDSDKEKPTMNKKLKKKLAEKSAHNSRSGTPVDATPSAALNKRKAEVTNNSDNSNSSQSTPAKKPKIENTSAPATSYASFNSSKDNFANTEEAVRRYLTRKPMTTTELLKKIQSKKTGVSSDELVDMMTAILKKINPSKQRTQGKMYLSLKPT